MTERSLLAYAIRRALWALPLLLGDAADVRPPAWRRRHAVPARERRPAAAAAGAVRALLRPRPAVVRRVLELRPERRDVPLRALADEPVGDGRRRRANRAAGNREAGAARVDVGGRDRSPARARGGASPQLGDRLRRDRHRD